MHKLEELDPREKKVLVRVDWNVTIGKTLQIVDDTRIRRTIPTLRWLKTRGVRQVTILAHLGKTGEEQSLMEVARYAEKLFGQPIKFWQTLEQCQSDTESRVKMLENLRMWEGEDKNEPGFAEQLASMGEVYVNEAFGEAHRESASIVGIPQLLPGYAGINLEQEVATIRKVVDNPERPLVVIMGGAKVDDKIKLLDMMSHKADVLLIGGKLANEFGQRGIELTGKAKIVVPVEGYDLLDIGEETQQIFHDEIAQAKTVIWNGPMGKVEEDYRAGTQAVYEALIRNKRAFTVVGGGDTLAAIREEKQLERIDFVSTGGGAMLKLIERGTLPGIEALR